MTSLEQTRKLSFVQSILSYPMKLGITFSALAKATFLVSLVLISALLEAMIYALKLTSAFIASLSYFAMTPSLLSTFPVCGVMVSLTRPLTYRESLSLHLSMRRGNLQLLKALGDFGLIETVKEVPRLEN